MSNTKLPLIAPLWRRLAALVYDGVLIIALSMAYGAITYALHQLFSEVKTQGYTPTLSGPLFQLGWVFTIASFYYYFWKRAGQTAGMRAWRIRVASLDNEPLSTKQCMLRLVFAPLSFTCLLAGYWWCLFDKNGDTLHDKFSATRIFFDGKIKR